MMTGADVGLKKDMHAPQLLFLFYATPFT
jgi:hypothetical protein